MKSARFASIDEEIAFLKKRKAELEDELKDNSLLANAVDSTSESILIADLGKPDQPIIYANEAFEKMTGYSRADMYVKMILIFPFHLTYLKISIGRNCRFLQGKDTNRNTTAKIHQAMQKVTSCN